MYALLTLFVHPVQQIRESTARVQLLMTSDKNFKSFMAQLTQNEGVDVLGLQSYLIKPLQRITKVGFSAMTTA